MAYEKTEWVSGETPLSADNLNKIENELETLDATVQAITIKTLTTSLTTDSNGTASVPSNMSSKTIISVRSNNYQYSCFHYGGSIRVYKTVSDTITRATNVSVPMVFTYIG